MDRTPTAGEACRPVHWWTIVQALAWIITGTDEVVERVAHIRSIGGLNGLRPRNRQPPLFPDQAPAELMRAAREGRLPIFGRMSPNDLQKRIPRHPDALLIDRSGIAAIGTESQLRVGVSWSWLCVQADDCRRCWPAHSATKPTNETKAPVVDGTQAPRQRAHGGRASQADHNLWYVKYRDALIAVGKSSSGPEDEAACKDALRERYDRERLRTARREHAPDTWKSTGMRRGKR